MSQQGTLRLPEQDRGPLGPSAFPHLHGAFADHYYLRPGGAVFRVPDTLSDDVVAPVNCALSQVLYGLTVAGLRFGDSVVIQGAGGLGVQATAVAKEMGGATVIVIDQMLSLVRSGVTDTLGRAAVGDDDEAETVGDPGMFTTNGRFEGAGGWIGLRTGAPFADFVAVEGASYAVVANPSAGGSGERVGYLDVPGDASRLRFWAGVHEYLGGCGGASVAFVLALSRIVPGVESASLQKRRPEIHWLAAARYPFWLLKEIVLANLQVARIILHPRLPIDPVLVQFDGRLGRAARGRTLEGSKVELSVAFSAGTATLYSVPTKAVVAARRTVHRSLAADGIDDEGMLKHGLIELDHGLFILEGHGTVLEQHL